MLLQSILLCLLGKLWCAFAQEGYMSGKETINVKTVLFRDSDIRKPCWALEDVNLLIARKLMQDLLPRKLPTDFDMLAEYIKTVLDVVKTKSPPESAQRITTAAYDVLGGYLKTVAIPILNEAYYAGNVQFPTAAEIHSLYGRIMCFLRTDGGGWSSPIDMRKIPTKVRALDICMTNASDACCTLEMRYATGSEPSCSPREISKVSIPYLDDNSYPNAIAVPLRGNSLFSLMSNCSANLLPKFYILAMRCLASNAFSKKDVVTFNHQFYDWIISSVVPHVHEANRWYPGFGGVMRIVETMNQKGLASSDSVRPDTSPCENQLPPVEGIDEDTKPWWKRFLIFIVTGALLFVFLCCCCCYCIMRWCFKPPPPDPATSNEGLAKTLVSIYCGVKDSIVGGKNPPCPEKEESKSSSKSASGDYDACRDPFYSSSEEGDSSAPSSGD